MKCETAKCKALPYFFGYKTEFFSFQNNPKNLDPSYKMDLDLWRLFRKGKTHIIAKFQRTYLVICSHSREGKTLCYSRINTVIHEVRTVMHEVTNSLTKIY